MEAVASAGGVLRTAAPKKARVLRRGPNDDKRTELAIDIQKIMQGQAEDLRLAAGDILVVPDSSGKRVTARAVEAMIQAGTIVGTYAIIR
jgi:protein involved in polysaccharide export with SLBB domain